MVVEDGVATAEVVVGTAPGVEGRPVGLAAGAVAAAAGLGLLVGAVTGVAAAVVGEASNGVGDASSVHPTSRRSAAKIARMPNSMAGRTLCGLLVIINRPLFRSKLPARYPEFRATIMVARLPCPLKLYAGTNPEDCRRLSMFPFVTKCPLILFLESLN